ncbi:MAG: DEAD/DEAH box helicase [Propionibacteriaceae bacterium]|jgi:superfamily II DNA/RNA helicase|nr:DEAD/DEAH box helicase [Propionibacteriaceae bacterium]
MTQDSKTAPQPTGQIEPSDPSETNDPSGTVEPEQPSFASLGVSPVIVDSLTAAGFEYAFPIQHLAIAIALQGSDLIGQARTGTGKTLAFGIPLLQRICLPGDEGYDPDQRRLPQALVMCPTRELALQVSGDLEVVGRARGAKVLTVYGGVGYEPQLDGLAEGVDVVVGTPGRLLDLLGRRSLVLSAVKALVLDEADEMLDLGFLPDVERIIAQTPTERQTMLFSATMPSAIVGLARAHLKQPINIRAEAHDASMTVPETTQFVYQAHDLDKPTIVGKLLQAPSATRVMVFCRTKRSVQRLADDLVERGFTATCIHGDLSQVVRERALARFRAGKAQVLVATDVAARGIDVDQVSHVVNYDCPDDEKTYVHRIGRTGRAGHTGVAVTLVDWADLTRWKMINHALGLSFDTLLEAYSTTAQLLEELEIPADASGWLTAPPERPRPARAPARSAARPAHRSASDRAERSDRSERSSRQRTRRRNGVPVSRNEASSAATPAGPDEAAPVPPTTATTTTTPAVPDLATAAPVSDRPPRSRRTSAPKRPSADDGEPAAASDRTSTGRPRRRRRSHRSTDLSPSADPADVSPESAAPTE